MAYAFWQLIAETSWYTYFLFFFILTLAQNARKPRILSLTFLAVLPLLFIMLSSAALYNLTPMNQETFFYWAVGGVLGAPVGWLQFKWMGIKGVKNNRAVYVPGTNTLYAITVILLFGNYYLRYHLAISALDLLSTQNAKWLVLFYGTFTGLFLGRLMFALWRIRKGPFITLPETTEHALASR